MPGKGRGLRTHKVEVPKPRKSSTDTCKALQSEINKMVTKIKQGCIEPDEAKAFSHALKDIGAKSDAYNSKGYIQDIVALVRSCLLTVPFVPAVRVYLIEIVELAASGWDKDTPSSYYYKNKAEALKSNYKTFTKPKLHHSFSHPGACSYAARKPLQSSEALSGCVLTGFSQVQRLSEEMYNYSKDMFGFKIAISENNLMLANGNRDVNIGKVENLTGAQLVFEEAKKATDSDDRCVITIIGPSQGSIWAAISMLEELLLRGCLPEQVAAYSQCDNESLHHSSHSSLYDKMTSSCDEDVFSLNDSYQILTDSGNKSVLQCQTFVPPTKSTGTPRPSSRESDEAIPSSVMPPMEGNASFVNAENQTKVKVSESLVCDVYVRDHIVRLCCDDRDILQEVHDVLSAHFAHQKNGRNSSSFYSENCGTLGESINMMSPKNIQSTPVQDCLASRPVHLRVSMPDTSSGSLSSSSSSHTMSRTSDSSKGGLAYVATSGTQTSRMPPLTEQRQQTKSGLRRASAGVCEISDNAAIYKGRRFKSEEYVSLHNMPGVCSALSPSSCDDSTGGELQPTSEKKRQQMIQYGKNFLLACSRSPIAMKLPEDWQFREDLPDICLHKPSSYFDPTKYDSPQALQLTESASARKLSYTQKMNLTSDFYHMEDKRFRYTSY